MMPALAYTNILTADLDRVFGFYRQLLGFEEVAEHRSPIHRALDAGGCFIGFNADEAFGLLRLERGGAEVRDRSFLTFEMGGRANVDHAVEVALALGGSVVKPAGETGYGWYQAVLRDPEGNAFRLNTVVAE